MAIKMVRQPSETTNINNIDDIIPFRYAYGNQNGYVIGKGSELSYSVNGSDFIVNSGRVVIQGVETDIDANGFAFTIDNNATTRYYVVYNEVNLATNESTLKLVYDTATYPIIESGDDLNEFTTGIARTSLYKFSAVNGVISNVEKVVQPIKYTKDVEVEWSTNSRLATDSTNVTDTINGNKISDIFAENGKSTAVRFAYKAGETSFTISPISNPNISSNFSFLLDLKEEYDLYAYLQNVELIVNKWVFKQKENSIINLGIIKLKRNTSTFFTMTGLFTRTQSDPLAVGDYAVTFLVEFDGTYFNFYLFSNNSSYVKATISSGTIIYKIIE